MHVKVNFRTLKKIIFSNFFEIFSSSSMHFRLEMLVFGWLRAIQKFKKFQKYLLKHQSAWPIPRTGPKDHSFCKKIFKTENVKKSLIFISEAGSCWAAFEKVTSKVENSILKNFLEIYCKHVWSLFGVFWDPGNTWKLFLDILGTCRSHFLKFEKNHFFQKFSIFWSCF